jgi:hypothetical protein
MGEALAIWHLPEHITHLYYSPVYTTLSLDQKLAYNRLHACYHCEFCAFLEAELPRHYLKAVSGPNIPEELRRAAQSLADSETWHATAFQTLARRISPGLYSGDPSNHEYVFVRPPIIRGLFDLPVLRPMLLWIALIQEERGAFFGEEVLRHPEELDPRMVDWQRRHLADEKDHISLGEALLPLYWDASPPWIRWLNGRLLPFVLREFLTAPKRTGIGVIEHLVNERPELLPRKAELLDAMRSLDGNPQFHKSVYSREIVPKTFALFDRYAEFRTLGKSLWGYSREAHP